MPHGMKITRAQRAKMLAGLRKYHARKRSKRAHDAVNGTIPTARVAARATGRALLVALARPQAERRIVELEKEIETLRLFLAKTQ